MKKFKCHKKREACHELDTRGIQRTSEIFEAASKLRERPVGFAQTTSEMAAGFECDFRGLKYLNGHKF